MITLEKITEQNLKECIALRVSDNQKQFICSTETSLKEAEEEPDIARPFALYAANEIIGFTMFAFDESNENPADKYWLWRFMIDKNKQNQGYGSAALTAIISYFREHHADQITLSTSPANIEAISFYEKRGFQKNGQLNEDEIVLKYLF